MEAEAPPALCQEAGKLAKPSRQSVVGACNRVLYRNGWGDGDRDGDFHFYFHSEVAGADLGFHRFQRSTWKRCHPTCSSVLAPPQQPVALCPQVWAHPELVRRALSWPPPGGGEGPARLDKAGISMIPPGHIDWSVTCNGFASPGSRNGLGR
jgi:hypothetical protein